MLGGVGLAMTPADVEGVALATPGFGRTHPPSVKPTRVLSARRPMDARIISPPARPRGALALAPITAPLLRRGLSPGSRRAGRAHSAMPPPPPAALLRPGPHAPAAPRARPATG